jgi:hypothetical protein
VKITAHLALLHTRRIERLEFMRAELEHFAARLQAELAEMADFTPGDW